MLTFTRWSQKKQVNNHIVCILSFQSNNKQNHEMHPLFCSKEMILNVDHDQCSKTLPMCRCISLKLCLVTYTEKKRLKKKAIQSCPEQRELLDDQREKEAIMKIAPREFQI